MTYSRNFVGQTPYQNFSINTFNGSHKKKKKNNCNGAPCYSCSSASMSAADGTTTATTGPSATETQISTWGSKLLGLYDEVTGASPSASASSATSSTDSSAVSTTIDPAVQNTSYTVLYWFLGSIAVLVIIYFAVKAMKNRKK